MFKWTRLFVCGGVCHEFVDALGNSGNNRGRGGSPNLLPVHVGQSDDRLTSYIEIKKRGRRLLRFLIVRVEVAVKITDAINVPIKNFSRRVDWKFLST